MRIVTKRRVREYWENDKSSEKPLDAWYKAVKKLRVSNLADLRKIFPHADLVGKCTVFNVGGNKYRVIVKINYVSQTVFIKNIMTHKEYDLDKWKKDCV